jgi:WD40 repeat protein
MKKLLMFLNIFCLMSGFILHGQEQDKTFNDRISIPAISFSSDGRYMAIGGSAKIYDLALGAVDFRTIEKDSEAQGDYAFNVIISPDDRTMLVTKFKQLEIWDLQIRKLKKRIRDANLAVKAACFSPDGQYIIYLRKNGEIVFINASTLTESLKNWFTILHFPVPVTILPYQRKMVRSGLANTLLWNWSDHGRLINRVILR